MTKKLGLLVPSAICLVVLLAVPALAGSELPPPNDPNVRGLVVQPRGATGGIAFTGGNVRMWMVLAVGLLVIGAGLLIAGRRRRANAAP
jgi:hypothetical protein